MTGASAAASGVRRPTLPARRLNPVLCPARSPARHAPSPSRDAGSLPVTTSGTVLRGNSSLMGPSSFVATVTIMGV